MVLRPLVVIVVDVAKGRVVLAATVHALITGVTAAKSAACALTVVLVVRFAVSAVMRRVSADATSGRLSGRLSGQRLVASMVLQAKSSASAMSGQRLVASIVLQARSSTAAMSRRFEKPKARVEEGVASDAAPQVEQPNSLDMDSVPRHDAPPEALVEIDASGDDGRDPFTLERDGEEQADGPVLPPLQSDGPVHPAGRVQSGQGERRSPAARAPADSDIGPRAGRRKRDDNNDVVFETFRLEVGHAHGVKPGNIVGAIANEAGLEGRHIGHVDIHDDHSFVDLPEGCPGTSFAT